MSNATSEVLAGFGATWELDFEHECLMLGIVPTRVSIVRTAVLKVAILRDKVVVAEREEKVLAIESIAIHECQSQALPLLIQQDRVLGTTVVNVKRSS